MRQLLPLETKLFEAIEQANLKSIEHLLDKGANINALNASGETPLSVACHSRNPLYTHMLVEYLINKGADINKFDTGGYTPLFNAVVANRPLVVQTLLEKGANPNINFFPEDNPEVKSSAMDIAFQRYLSVVIKQKKGYDDFNILEQELSTCRSILFLLTEAGARRHEREPVPEYS